MQRVCVESVTETPVVSAHGTREGLCFSEGLQWGCQHPVQIWQHSMHLVKGL